MPTNLAKPKVEAGVLKWETGDVISTYSRQGPAYIQVELPASDLASVTSNSECDISVLSGFDVPKLEIIASSSGDIQVESVKATSISLSSDSSGDVNVLDATFDSCTLESSSSGDVLIASTGSGGTASADSSSSGWISIEKEQVAVTIAEISSSGMINLLSPASIAGEGPTSSGTINVYGSPTEDSDISSGDVNNLDGLGREDMKHPSFNTQTQRFFQSGGSGFICYGDGCGGNSGSTSSSGYSYSTSTVCQNGHCVTRVCQNGECWNSGAMRNTLSVLGAFGVAALAAMLA